MDKLLIITGATATGKTSLSIELAKKFNGEIVSADSRQVYKFMDIGTGKDKNEYLKNGIKVWGIDLVNPDYNFNVSDYLKFVVPTISDIQKRNKLPILVGGTALYIKALLEPIETLNVPPNEVLRNNLENYSVGNLQEELKKIDEEKWKKMNLSDRKNPRRLVRAIEVAKFLIENSSTQAVQSEAAVKNDTLLISLAAGYDFLYRRIDTRVDDRIKQGALEEVEKLLKMGYSFSLPSMTASGYKEFKDYPFGNSLSGETLATCVQQWKFNEHNYARRQFSFINKFLKQQAPKGTSVHVFNIESSSWHSEIFQLMQKWCIMNANDPKKT